MRRVAVVVMAGGGGEQLSATNRLTYIFGADMTPGTSEAQAAAGFLAQHGSLFGGTFTEHEPEVRQLWSVTAKDESFTSFAYRQLIRGKEVEGSDIRIKVKRGTIARVDYAAARIAGEPTAGSENPYLTAEAASLFVRVWSGIENLVVQGTPEEVVLRGEGQRPDAWCWRVNARIGENASAAFRTYFVDTAMPRVMLVQDNEFSCAAPRSVDPPTTGTVTGLGAMMESPFFPYQGDGQTLVTHPIPNVKVVATLTPSGSASTYTNQDGEFSFAPNVNLTNVGSAIANLVAESGTWYYLYVPDLLSASSSATPGSNVDLVLDHLTMSTEFKMGQVSAIVGAKRARDFFANYIGTSFTGWSYPVEIVPNQFADGPEDCGSFGYNEITHEYLLRLGQSWGNSTDGRWNCASASVTAHEYGHGALYLLELSDPGNGAFKEGYGDVYASMLNDDSVFGREHNKNMTPIRGDPSDSSINCQSPVTCHLTSACTCAHHLAGQLLSGPWVRIREGLKLEYGYTDGVEAARVLFARWSLITVGGGAYCVAAHPGTLAEVLSFAKDEGQELIVTQSFASHNIELESEEGCP